MAYADNRFHFVSAIAALLGAILIQIGTNFANDYYDFKKGADTHKRIGPTRATQAGLVTPRAMLIATSIVFTLAFLIGIYLVYRGGWPIVTVGLFSILFGVLYTGGPFPIGYLGLGELFVLFFFGIVAVAGTYWVQALTMSKAVLLAGVPPGLLSSAVLVVNNLRDAPTDKLAGKHTLAVRFGTSFARFEYIACVFLAAIIPYWLHAMTDRPFWHILTPLVLIPAWPTIKSVSRSSDGPTLNAALGNTAKLLILYTLLFAFGWLW
jgi:1,4-dihydroxy-2-naphthoate octaprenyltransferase